MRIALALLLCGCFDAYEVSAVSHEQHYGVTGLYREANPFTKPPPGAMLRADEVVFRRLGLAEPRPGFKEGTEVTLNGIYKLIPFGASVLHVGGSAGDPTSTTRWTNNTAVRDESSNVLLWTRDAIRGVEARSNLYVTTQDATRRIMSSTDTAALRAGVEPPWLKEVTDGSSGSAVANNTLVAYRATIEVKLASGLVLTSAPSGRVVYNNTSGTTQDPNVVYGARIPVISGATIAIKLYRSLAVATGDPDDNLYLVKAVDFTASTGLQSGSLSGVDKVTEANLGEELYTNPSATNGGAARANIRPPACKDLALYQGSLFFANITRQARAVLRYIEGGTKTSSATGIGIRTYTGTRTNASNQITGLSSTTGLQVGMLLTSSTNWSASPVRITAIVGSDLTMSATWNGATDGAPASISFADAINVGSNYYRTDQLRTLIDDYNKGETASFLYGNGVVTKIVGSTPQNQARSFTIEAVLATTTLAIRATHGDEYDPPLPLVSATAKSFAPEAIAHGIAWTKNQEPEHHILAAIDRVGHQASPILRIHATRDAIWILKGQGDGLYRLSGFGELTGWRVDKFDSDTFLLHNELSAAMDDVVYSWTNKGAVAVSDAGVVPLSRPFIGTDVRSFELELPRIANVVGLFGAANPVDNEVIFGVPDPDGDGSGAAHHVYVLHVPTRRWSKWFAGATVYRAAVFDPGQGRLMFARTDSNAARLERGSLDTVWKADREFSATINTVTGQEVVIAGGSSWTPAVGDMIVRTGVFAIVTAVASGTAFTVHTTGLPTGAATAYEAFTSYLSWLPKASAGGSATKLWQSQVLHWEDTQGIYGWDVIASGSADQGSSSTRSDTRTYLRGSQRRDNTNMPFTPDVAWNPELYPSLQVKQADARWRLSGMTLVHSVVSKRVRR